MDKVGIERWFDVKALHTYTLGVSKVESVLLYVDCFDGCMLLYMKGEENILYSNFQNMKDYELSILAMLEQHSLKMFKEYTAFIEHTNVICHRDTVVEVVHVFKRPSAKYNFPVNRKHIMEYRLCRKSTNRREFKRFLNAGPLMALYVPFVNRFAYFVPLNEPEIVFGTSSIFGKNNTKSKSEKEIANYAHLRGGTLMLNDPVVVTKFFPRCINAICDEKLKTASKIVRKKRLDIYDQARRMTNHRVILTESYEKKLAAMTKKLQDEKKQHVEMYNRVLASAYDKVNIEKMQKRTAEAAKESGDDIRTIDVNMTQKVEATMEVCDNIRKMSRELVVTSAKDLKSPDRRPTSRELLLSSATELKCPGKRIGGARKIEGGDDDIRIIDVKDRKRPFDDTKVDATMEVKPTLDLLLASAEKLRHRSRWVKWIGGARTVEAEGGDAVIRVTDVKSCKRPSDDLSKGMSEVKKVKKMADDDDIRILDVKPGKETVDKADDDDDIRILDVKPGKGTVDKKTTE